MVCGGTALDVDVDVDVDVGVAVGRTRVNEANVRRNRGRNGRYI